MYGHYGCSFKLIIQTFICKILPRKNRRVFKVDFDLFFPNNQVSKEKLIIIEKTKDASKNKFLSGFLEHLRPVLVASSNAVLVSTLVVIALIFSKSSEFVINIAD